jgi:hypothetical protein
MTKKAMIFALIFVIIAGAIAGAFVFLGQLDDTNPAALPGAADNAGQTGVADGLPRAIYDNVCVQKPGSAIEVQRMRGAGAPLGFADLRCCR